MERIVLNRKMYLQPSTVKKVATAAAKIAPILVLMVASHSFGWPLRILGGLISGAGMGLLGYQRGSLSASGSHRSGHLLKKSVWYRKMNWQG